MKYVMSPREDDYFSYMECDILFNTWWSKVAGDNNIPSTKKIAYAAWQAGIANFIEHQTPIAWWETSKKVSDHVTFDSKLAEKWKSVYNMKVEILYMLPATKVLETTISKECID